MRVLGVGLHALDGLDLMSSEETGSASAREEGEIVTYRIGDVGEVDEAALLLAKSVDQLNLAILAKVLAELLLRVDVKVLDVSNL
jgi:hypothetical protein